MCKVEIEDRVLCTSEVGYLHLGNQKGRVININNGIYIKRILVEFDVDIHGHDCNGIGNVRGKAGHCWWCQPCDLIVIDKTDIKKQVKVFGIVRFYDSFKHV